MRLCNVCDIEKDESKFDKHRYTCCNCRYKQHRDRLLKKGLLPKKKKKRKCKTPEEKKEVQRRYYENNKDKIILRNRDYRDRNREKVRAASRKYREANIDRLKKYEKEYRMKHKERRRIQNRESEKRRMIREPGFKLRKYLRNAIYCALIRNKSSKNGLSILKFLPYSMIELKSHLESQFENWMSWNNWGIYDSSAWNDNEPSTWTWQLDHIIPQSHFNYASMEDDDFMKCWALSNLRPYSAKTNCMENTPRSRNVL